MTNQKRTKKFEFGNERFGGSYTPGDFEINFPEDMSREEFGRLFHERMLALHKKYDDNFDEEIFHHKPKKEKLKPLSIRVKPHTKEFFKNHSILSPRDVLEMYEEFNNGSEAFINSLIEEEKQLEQELIEIQEKLHNAKLFKEKLVEIEPEGEVSTDEDKLARLQNIYNNTLIKSIGNETPIEKAKQDIVKDIQIYNTLDVSFNDNEFLIITVYTNAQPIAYYFKNECSDEDISEIISHVEEYCSENEIDFRKTEKSN
ncbi:hypothetical protein [Methanobrevibacter sp.]|uniref:hypothetical protein n=1 Tax=Methanobrevibacter sp. TaxID=66852 RepID=UPI0025F23230|nr:hypothetical protein [Methanobrevibacter sp.]MBQ2666779.1 hypothetical protein [Methanobrevibacter sp.]